MLLDEIKAGLFLNRLWELLLTEEVACVAHGLKYGLEDKPPFGELMFFGLQWLAITFRNYDHWEGGIRATV